MTFGFWINIKDLKYLSLLRAPFPCQYQLRSPWRAEAETLLAEEWKWNQIHENPHPIPNLSSFLGWEAEFEDYEPQLFFLEFYFPGKKGDSKCLALWFCADSEPYLILVLSLIILSYQRFCDRNESKASQEEIFPFWIPGFDLSSANQLRNILLELYGVLAKSERDCTACTIRSLFVYISYA